MAGERRSWAWALLGMLAAAAVSAGFGASYVTSGSMAPALLPGDVAVYARSARGVRKGDVVLYEKSGFRGGVLHRVSRVLPTGELVTRGDANPIEDLRPVPRRLVRGEVVLVVPFGTASRSLARLIGKW